MNDEVYVPTEDEKKVAKLIGAWRHSTAMDAGNDLSAIAHHGEKKVAERDDIGALAEIATCRMTNLCWTACGKGTDGVPDVGGIIEVRSVVVPGKWASLQVKDRRHLLSLQAVDHPMAIILVQPDDVCIFVGWDYISELFKRARQYTNDWGQPFWMTPVHGLRSLPELRRVAMDWMWNQA